MLQEKQYTKNQILAISAILVAIGIVLPRLLHFLGPNVGKMFLPLYLPVVFAGLMLPFNYGVAISLILPIISNLISGMPPLPLLYFMILELFVLAFAINFLKRRFNPYLTILLGFLISRAFYGFSIIFTVNILGIELPFGAISAILTTYALSIPGIALQTILIPIIIKRLNKNN